ncbi:MULTISPECIES: hypothetical protein [unclassified Nostoc]|uniref:hypothetical protein n=1 Tax=unclassified Nostoc TaxID=2593658 RepID=UPI002AD4BE70|nr:hypothetical protein [Nostoc sp. ChiQUE02]MDZ8232502.1 hypothetical protein [Nostoc sp. ChiQUE02]
MSETQATNLLRVLLQKDPEQVQTWLRMVWAEQQQVPEKFNWLGLAEISTFRAQELANQESNESHSESLAWAEIATSVYEFLAENNPTFSESYLYSLMGLRAYTILKFGALPGNPVLDIQQIVNWFFDNLHISYQEALIKATDWRETLAANNPEETQKKFESELEDIRKLRLIKNRLGIIKRLSKSKYFLPNEELNIWISLWEKLP